MSSLRRLWGQTRPIDEHPVSVGFTFGCGRSGASRRTGPTGRHTLADRVRKTHQAAWTECPPGLYLVPEACRFWATPMDVAEWLRGLGLEQYTPAFRDNDID